MTRSIYRYEVPVDDAWHDLELRGKIVHVASRRIDVVEVWAIHDEQARPLKRRVRVFGTGHPLPKQARRHLGTAIPPGGQVVWHLMAQADFGDIQIHYHGSTATAGGMPPAEAGAAILRAMRTAERVT